MLGAKKIMNEDEINEIWKTEEGKYYSEIEEYLGRKRGYPVILTVKEWYIAKEWFDEGIPISVVKEAIDSVSRRKDMQNERISLAYCSNEVLRKWKDYKSIFSSKALRESDDKDKIEVDERYVVNHIDGLIENIEAIINNLSEKEEVLKVVFGKILISLRKMRNKYLGKAVKANTLEKLEQSLVRLESRMINSLVDNLPADILDKLLKESKEAILKYERALSDISYRKALETFVRKRLFDQFGIKRFSIYLQIMKKDSDEQGGEN